MKVAPELCAQILGWQREGVFVLDTGFVVQYANVAMAKLSGVPLDGFVGRHFIADFLDTPFSHIHEQAKQAMATQQEASWECKFTMPGVEFWRGGYFMPWSDGAQFKGLVCIVHDVTEAKQLAMRLRQAQLAAEATSAARGNFIATLSHEIRTPMNGILGMARQLVQAELPAPHGEYARTIADSGRTLLALLNDVLDLSKAEAGKFELDSFEFVANQLVQSTVTLFADQAASKGIALRGSWVGEPSAAFTGDGNRIRQMLSNLISNAVRFTDRGVVEVRGRELAVLPDKAVLEFEVIDTGVGVPAVSLDKLFMPFSQVARDARRNVGTSGLGLSIVKTLATQMGGDVGASSTEGKGSRFWFRVNVTPVSPGMSMPVRRTSTTRARTGGQFSGHVLVVEDHPVNRKVIHLMLSQLGVEVSYAEDGRQAIAAVTAAPPDLILMDLQMPELDGYEATRAIRAWEKSNSAVRVPIIALTASGYDSDRRRAFEVGMDDFMVKPVNQDDLVAHLGNWLPPQLG